MPVFYLKNDLVSFHKSDIRLILQLLNANMYQQVAPIEIYVKNNFICSQQPYMHSCLYPYWKLVLLDL